MGTEIATRAILAEDVDNGRVRAQTARNQHFTVKVFQGEPPPPLAPLEMQANFFPSFMKTAAYVALRGVNNR